MATEMKKLIIVPAYNEELNISKIIKEIKEYAPGFDYVVINDCSTDRTLDICNSENINYINLPVNLGIGGAMQTGYLYAYENGYDVAVQLDGDGQHDAFYVKEMLRVLNEKNVDMVIGSRYIDKEGFQSSTMRRAGIKYFTGLIKMITGKVITDPTSGFRMAGKKVIKRFACDYPRDYPEPESVVRLLKDKYNVSEIPVVMRPRQGGKSSISALNSVYYMVKVSIAIIVAGVK